ncbi:TNase-like domain-containing protein [Entamoeba marina]
MSSQKQSKQKGGEKQSFMGVVTRVISGETIEVRSNNELRTVHLAFITAPHFKRENAPEEKFAFEAREALRKKVIGKELKLVEEFVSANGTVFCIPFVGKSNVITYMLKTGYVVLRSKRESEEMKPYNDALEQAKTSKKVVIKAVEFNSNNAGKTIPVIIEYVMSATDFRVQLKKRGELSVRLAGGFGVSSDLKEGVIAEEAKDFCKQYVQRDAEMTVFPNEQDNRVFVTIKINGVNIIEEIAKMGYLRLNNNLPKGFSTEDKNSIQAAQTEAQKAKKGMWVDYDYEAEAKKIQEIKDKKVARVHSSKNIKGHLVEIVGMGLVIDNGSEQKTVYIANCFVPFLKEGVNHLVKNKFYGDEMRDALRKALVGREVTCIFCYESFGKSERSEKRGYYDVLVNKKNIAIDLIKNGIADCGFTKIEENKSGNYDELVEAFEYAKSKKNGHHNPKQVVKQFIDTTVKKSSKDNENILHL